MERQLKYFFDFLENDKKLSDNTLQSYKRDLKQFKRYIEACEINYNHVKEEDIKDYIKDSGSFVYVVAITRMAEWR